MMRTMNTMWTVVKDLVDDAQVDGLVLTKSKVLEKHLCVFLLSFSHCAFCVHDV